MRKVSLKHIHKISSARIEEIVKIISKKIKNLDIYKCDDYALYLYFEDKDVFVKFKKIFKNYFEK